jgi:hypothetical protein
MNRNVRGGSSDEPRGAAKLKLPYLRFYHSVSLRTKTLAVLEAIEEAEDATIHSEALASLVLELTEAGLVYYFVKPVQDAKVGFMAQQSTKLGIASIRQVMGPVARRVIGGMNATQLQSVSKHIRYLMK